MDKAKPTKIPDQSPILPPQQITDEQAVQIMNKLRTKASAVQISVEEIVGEMTQLFTMVFNQKNQEIKALKEAVVKHDIEKKLP